MGSFNIKEKHTYFNDFVKKITKISMYQMGKEYRDDRKESEWKVLEEGIAKI